MQLTLTRLSCPSCGAPLNFAPGTPVVVCPFCDTETLLADRTDLVESTVETRQVAPITTDADRFQRRLLAWLSDGDYTPDDILQKALLTEHAGLFLPFWRLSGEFHARFTASAGYDHKVEKIIERQRDDGSIDRRTTYETRTEWRPMSGEATGPYEVWVVGSASIPDELRDFVEQVMADAQDLHELSPELMAGHLVEDFGVDASTAMAARGRGKITGRVEEACRNRVPGDKCKDLRVDFDTRDELAEAALHPFWIAAFEYGGETFPVAFSGRDLDRVQGRRPEDKARKDEVAKLHRPWKWSLGVTIVLSLLGFCAGVFPGFVALLVGGITTGGLLWTATSKTNALLEASKEVRRKVLQRVQSTGTPPGEDD